MKNNIPIDSTSRIQGFEKTKPKTRGFYKRSKYQKLKRKESMKRITSLVCNLSDFPVTGSMESLLNHGLSFVPVPKKLNITQLKADIDKYSRSMLWKHFWFENKEDMTQSFSLPSTQDITQDVEKAKSFLKSNKSNLPRSNTPMPLSMYLNSIHSDIVGSCRRNSEIKQKDNLSQKEREAIKSLKEAQSQGQITIKEVDKGGGICIMNTIDYILEMNSQLQAIFKSPDGSETPFYIQVKEDSLNKKKLEIQKLIKFGTEQNIISDADAKIMDPNG